MVNINFEVKTEELHRSFKIKCINRGQSLEERLNYLMEKDVDGKAGEFSEIEEGE